jgi:serine/threonine protein kinase
MGYKKPVRQSLDGLTETHPQTSGLSEWQCIVIKQYVTSELKNMKLRETSEEEASQTLRNDLSDPGGEVFPRCRVDIQGLFAKHQMNAKNIASLDETSLDLIIASGQRSTEADLKVTTKVATVHHRDSCHRVMIIKFPIKPTDSNSSMSMAFLRNSAKHLNDLDHDRVLQCFGSYKTPHEREIFFEHVVVSTVADLIFEHGVDISTQLVNSVTRQVSEGLEYLHYQEKMVHNAINSDTIRLDTKGVVKIAGFGLSLRKDEAAFPDSLVTYIEAGHETFWLAPEIIDRKECSYASDIWSLGCLVAEMCTRKRPMSLLANLKSEQTLKETPTVLELVQEVDEPYKTCLSRMIRKEAEERCTAELLVGAFEKEEVRMHGMYRNFAKEVSPEHVAANVRAFYAWSCIGPRLTRRIHVEAAAEQHESS